MTNATPRTADLQLRSLAGPVLARIHWPVPSSTAPKLLVFFPTWTASDDGRAGMPDAAVLCRYLCACSGLVVLLAPCRNAEEAIPTTEWAAEHANELGADDSTIALAGDGPGADLADTVAQHATDTGWPVIDRLVLINPTTSARRGVGAVELYRAPGGELADVAAAVHHALDPTRGLGSRAHRQGGSDDRSALLPRVVTGSGSAHRR